MKKTYISPSMAVFATQLYSMLTISIDSKEATEANANDAASRGGSIWDDE